MTTILPDCMMPDGADPCAGYRQLVEQNDRLRAERDAAVLADTMHIAMLHKAEAERDALRDKALRFDLDAAGIEQREREAVELVELRAERDALRDHVKLQGKLIDDAEVVLVRQRAERDRLRELLREAFDALTSNEDTCNDYNDLRGRIDAALRGEGEG